MENARKLSTIQKRENLNRVYSTDVPGPGTAHHNYDIVNSETGEVLLNVQFQNGPRKSADSIPGVLDGDLLEIVRDRMKSFQGGPFASDYNAKALEYIELALMYLNRRVEDRIERNVLGTYQK